jgi:hypothetical protein
VPGRFRAITGAFAKGLPPKHVTDRIVPWLTLTVTVVGVTIGLWQYIERNSNERVARVVELHKTYIGLGSSTSSLSDLRRESEADQYKLAVDVKCQFMKELNAKSDCRSDASFSPDQRAALRGRIDKAVVTQFGSSETNRRNLGKLLGFYLSLVTCVDQDACDTGAAVRFFASDILSFLNQNCPLIADEARRWRVEPPDIVLAKFLVKNKEEFYSAGLDAGRQSMFLCDHLRQQEQ